MTAKFHQNRMNSLRKLIFSLKSGEKKAVENFKDP